jgi:N-acetylglucosaminyldiphosphoundecaprenol N-acetyl-beta-D-mannosaminyltransferase
MQQRAAPLGVGGLFDYYSGNIPRAPLWMRQIGMEWAFRLTQEPGRLWKRYLLGNWAFLGRITIDRLHQSLAGKHK